MSIYSYKYESLRSTKLWGVETHILVSFFEEKKKRRKILNIFLKQTAIVRVKNIKQQKPVLCHVNKWLHTLGIHSLNIFRLKTFFSQNYHHSSQGFILCYVKCTYNSNTTYLSNIQAHKGHVVLVAETILL